MGRRRSTSRKSVNLGSSARNLKKTDLGGVIFGCKNYTFDECHSKKLFGLPAAHYSYVRNVSPGMILFLFNYSSRMLYGIYEAAEAGKLNIDTHAWTDGDLEITPFPAQVRVMIRSQCLPLKEEDFKPVIADNYYDESHFWFELDKNQTQKLLSMFKYPLAPQKISAMPQRWSALHGASSCPPSGEGGFPDAKATILQSVEFPSTFNEIPPENQNSVSSTNCKSWISLFKSGAVPNPITETEKCPPTCEELEKVQEKENPQPEPDWECSSSLASPPICEDCSSREASVLNQADPNVEWDATSAPSVCGEIPFEDASVPSLTVMTISEEASLLRECHSGPDSPDLTSLTEEFVMNMESSDVHSVAVKLVHALREIKVSQARKTQELDVLKQELEHSKTENERLKASSSLLTLQDEGSKSTYEINSSILLVGGFDGSTNLPSLDCYSPFYDCVKPLQPMGTRLLYAASVRVNDEVYILGGGGDGTSCYDTVKSYNVAHDSWTTGPSLSRRKRNLAGIGLGNKIFALGGEDGVDCVSEIEMYDLNVGKWIPTGSMLQKRFALAAAEVGGMIYITGGHDGHQYMQSVEAFDPRQRSSIPLQSMKTRRGCHSLTVLNEKLYAIGGYDGANMVPNVEVFDPRFDSWMMVEPMNHKRGCFGAATIGSSIYAIGGTLENGQAISTVERYSEGIGWQMVNTKAVGKRGAFATVLL